MEQTYDYNLKIITVKGVGHMVPEDNPKVAKILLDKFIEYNRIDQNQNEDDSFPIWAFILISVGSLLIIILIVIIVVVKCKKNPDSKMDEKDKLLTDAARATLN